MRSEINRQMRDGIRKWEIVNPDDPDQGLRASTPQRSSAGCSAYQQCVLERCDSEIQYHHKPGAAVAQWLRYRTMAGMS
ncbi:hypothetical protein TNCV_839841 [Trichonephila clavipes]|nr:hypothetical protein TNCV_839841 [Trichonephila clavipes]